MNTKDKLWVGLSEELNWNRTKFSDLVILMYLIYE